MKSALYVRVSSDMQIDNYSISAQLNELNNYCLKNCIEVFEKYIDEGYSSKNDKRPGFRKMIKDAENKKFDIILVHEYSRFASNYELSKSLEEKLKKNNITVISITEKTDNTPSGFFQRLIMQGLAEWRLRNLAVHVKKSQTYMISEKGLNHGASCYGYDMIDKKLVINEKEAKIVKLIFDMYINGQGCHKIAKHFIKNNIMTRKGNYFRLNTIKRILNNVKYIGKIQYDKKVYIGEHDPIIDEKKFNLVQIKLQKNKFPVRQTNTYDKFYLLGILHCGECGANMRVTRNKYYSYYYSCSKLLERLGFCNCNKYYRTEILEKDIENAIYEFLQDDIINFTARIDFADNSREILERRLSKIPEEIERIKNVVVAGIMTIEEGKKKKKSLENEQQQLQQELNNLKNNIFDINKSKKIIKTIWESFIFEEDICKKREILKNEINKIYINRNGHIELVFVDKSEL